MSVRLTLGDRIVNLLEDHVDLALRIGTLPDSGLVATTLGAVRRVACASPAYLAAHAAPRHPRDLAGHTCIGFEYVTDGSTWRFRGRRGEIVVPIQPRLVVNTAEAAIVNPRKRAVFESVCAAEDVTPSQVVRRIVREYIEARLGRPWNAADAVQTKRPASVASIQERRPN